MRKGSKLWLGVVELCMRRLGFEAFALGLEVFEFAFGDWGLSFVLGGLSLRVCGSFGCSGSGLRACTRILQAGLY